MSGKSIYKISFINQDKVYEVYARQVGPSGIMGFIEIAEMVFGEKSSLLVDPGEESLKSEFKGVKRSHIPMHCVLRIDEVDKQGQARIIDGEAAHNIRPFPSPAGMPDQPGSPS